MRQTGSALAILAVLASMIVGVAPVSAEPPGAEASLAVGDDHSCFLIAEGKISCVGDGDSGQLGAGDNFEDRRKPHLTVNLEGAIAVSAGEDHSCAVLENGRVMCWGDNDNGQLGNGGGPDESAPVFVNGISDAVAIAAGDNHSCAVRAAGTVRCWGDNSDGQLGDGTRTDRATPVAVSSVGRAQAVAAGQFHTCVVTSTDHVSCWGDNSKGQLGDGSTNDRLTAFRVAQVEEVSSVAAGFGHTCATEFGGAVKCWGDNSSGQLGDGTTVASLRPVTVVGVSSGRQVSVGYRNTCVVDAGVPKCWGNNEFGQLGNGTITPSLTPVAVAWNGPVSAVGVGDDHSCLIADDRRVACWGDNTDGQLGKGNNEANIVPFVVDAEAYIAVVNLPPPTSLEELVNRPDFISAHADILRLYQAFFSRDPDVGGAQYWINQYRGGQSVRRIADRFTGTPEFEGLYAGTTNAEYVERVYQNILGRGPDQAGRTYWVGQLDSGMGRGEMVVLIATAAPEFVDANRYGGL